MIESLNEGQKQAVLHTAGPLMVLAGAGSGKTRTLVTKINYLLDQGLSAHQILAVTFSNKAAKEMRDRVATQTREQLGSLNITTFHAFCAYILRREFVHLGLSRNFTIYDDSESKAVAKNILGSRGISFKEISPFEVLNYISQLKNVGYYHDRELSVDEEVDQQDFFYGLYRDYEAELHKSNAVDFGGLIVGVIELFERFPEVLERYQNQFKYILVDEYQDTNRAQFDLITMLASKTRNLCVVGDEDQSIYSWRGADIRNILDFEKTFPEADLVKLEQNYRSSKIIIDAATSLISKNQMRKGKEMWTDNQEGSSITIQENPSDKDEANFLVDEISNLHESGEKYQDIAVFYRNNSQSRILEDYLRRRGLPYRIVGGIKFYERKEIKDVLGYLRLLVNPKDSLALGRIINVPTRGVGATSLRKLEGEAIKLDCSLWEVIEKIVDNYDDFSHLKLSRKIRGALSVLSNLVHEAQALASNQELPSLIVEKIIYESGYMDQLQSAKDYESQARIENIEELLNGVKQFEESEKNPSLLSYLESITLDTSVEGDQTEGQISLMTVHGSKGLEFPYVFITGAEENIFPSYLSLEGGETGLEEERRLFYVAMTRAMKKLYITFANGRALFGSMKFNGPSRFLYELPEDFIVWKRKEFESEFNQENLDSHEDYEFNQEYREAPSRPSPKKKILGSKSSASYASGEKIIHSLYGEGSILESEGYGGDEKVLIQFLDGTKKKFLVKFAPLTKI